MDFQMRQTYLEGCAQFSVHNLRDVYIVLCWRNRRPVLTTERTPWKLALCGTFLLENTLHVLLHPHSSAGGRLCFRSIGEDADVACQRGTWRSFSEALELCVIAQVLCLQERLSHEKNQSLGFLPCTVLPL